jgi:hypothetical protein
MNRSNTDQTWEQRAEANRLQALQKLSIKRKLWEANAQQQPQQQPPLKALKRAESCPCPSQTTVDVVETRPEAMSKPWPRQFAADVEITSLTTFSLRPFSDTVHSFLECHLKSSHQGI